jgi:hypothetical protein
MASKPAFKSTPLRIPLEVLLGKAEQSVGRLVFVNDGQREFSQFAYNEAWLTSAPNFDVSPDLSRQTGYQLRKPPTKNDSCFFWRWPILSPMPGVGVSLHGHTPKHALKMPLSGH